MISAWFLSALALAYTTLLFAIAFYGERHSVYPARTRLRPYIYGLALGVYCTTWTFFGAVGTAVREGWSYLPIYLGPALLWLAGLPFLARLVRVARERRVISIADFLASRFGKSPGLAALVTIIALTATIPYLALQYKAVAASLDALTPVGGPAPWYRDPALAVALIMAAFAVLFGTRRLDATEHHEGLMLAIAFESVVKLMAFAAVAVCALVALGKGPWPALPEALGGRMALRPADFLAITALAALAIFCLPRQFQVGVVECAQPKDLRHARWLFPAYLGVFSVCVVPVVAWGALHPAALRHPDTLILTLPLAAQQPWLAVLVFLGGLSAATAMVVVASIALATMVTNDLVVPLFWQGQLAAGADLGARILWVRRLAIVSFAILAYGYYRSSASPASLAAIGLLAFAAVAQFAPGIVAGLYWRGAARAGVYSGLIAGFGVWFLTLFLPNVASGGLEAGPAGPAPLWMRAGLALGLGPTATGASFALAANVVLLIGVSWLRGTSVQDRLAAKAFVGQGTPGFAWPPLSAKVGELEALAGRLVGSAAARTALEDYALRSGRAPLKPADDADRGLLRHIERLLAGAIGAPSARLMVTHALRRKGLDVDAVAELLDETSQELRFSRQLLLATMENVAQGISVVDAQLRLVAWNHRYLELFQYPEGLVTVGRPVAELIRLNARRGDLGAGEVEALVEKRLSHLRAATAYVFQRTRRDGRVYEIRGQPMPGGGFVTTYTDITSFKQNEQALLEAKQSLEARVDSRTLELSRALEAQRLAKQQAEEASASKTRFVAAASHDLLQPLNAARLFASALESRAGTDPELRALAGRIDSSMRAAEELLDGLLHVARLDSGALRPEESEFALAELLDDLERLYEPTARARKLDLRVRATRVAVRSDRALLRRILQNYIANALRYAETGRVLVGLRRRRGAVEIQVLDQGPGIPAHDLARIYTEFSRFGRASPWGEKGLGLGLSICDRIGRLLGHPLAVRSVTGRGSVFGVTVPLARRALSAKRAARAGPEPEALTGLAVLCIDNEPAILEGMQALLSRWGVRVLCARNGEGAAQALREEPVDVILADYHLDAGEDGLTLLALFAPRARHAVLVTADPGEEIARAARAQGVAILRKPLRPAALRALLSAYLARRERSPAA
jgi:PAS domain S-box-containing protein